jgi:AcrR family transcriptional regulator
MYCALMSPPPRARAQTYTGARPGGRSERVRRAVLDSAAETLLSGGLESLSLAGVAQAAGVHHTTVYRRWPTRSQLVLDTIVDLSLTRIPAPPTSGSVEADLIAYFTPIVEGMRDPLVQNLIRSLIALPEAEVASERRAYWEARHAVAASIVDAAVARGELPASVDVEHLVDVIAGPIWLRTLITGAGVDAALLRQLVREALARAGVTSDPGADN